MRFERLLLLGIAAGWFLLWIPGAPLAGVIEDPHCVPGTVSADGLQPCTACGAGTFSPGYGAIACQTCPAGTFASTPGAVSCAEPVTISFDGVVDEIFPDPNGPNPFAIGTTFEGYCIVNPTAPDTNPYAAGNFDGAVIEFAVRAGPIGSPLTGFATSGVAFVSDNSVDQLLLTTDDFSGASGATESFEIQLERSDGTLLDSAALAPALASVGGAFDRRILLWNYGNGIALAHEANVRAPEPGAGAVGSAGIVALITLRALRVWARRRSRGAR